MKAETKLRVAACAAGFALPRYKVGLVTAVLALVILLGGVRSIADAATPR